MKRVSWHEYLHETFIRLIAHANWCYSFIRGVFSSHHIDRSTFSCCILWRPVKNCCVWGLWCNLQLSNRESNYLCILFSMHFRSTINTLMKYIDDLPQKIKRKEDLDTIKVRSNALHLISLLLRAVAYRKRMWVWLGKAMYIQNESKAWFCHGFLLF